MLFLISQLALGGGATLHVGVHRDAGDISLVTPTSGACLVDDVTLECIVDGPIRFRWEGDPQFSLSGDTTIQPGQTGQAWVLATDEARAAEIARLAPGVVTLDDMLQLWIRTGENTPPIPSPGMFEALWKLAHHPDKKIRRHVVEALWPWVRDTSLDPLLPEAPEVVPDGLLTTLSRDVDKGVRRRTAALLKEIREGDLTPEARKVLLRLGQDPHQGVRRTAMASMAHAPWNGQLTAIEAWDAAMSRVPQRIPVGRKAAVTLAKLRREVDPEAVDALAALDLVLAHHPEKGWRFWSAWRKELPFERQRADRLLNDTVGLSRTLVKHWATHHPEAWKAALEGWQPKPEHQVRKQYMTTWSEAAWRADEDDGG